MPIKASVTGNTWPLSGAATAVTTGLYALTGTGLVHVGSSDVPPGSLATGYISTPADGSISVTLDNPATIFAASDVYTYSLWVRFRVTGTEPVPPANRRILDLSGEGIRFLFELYARPQEVIERAGLCHVLSKITGTGTQRTINTAPAGVATMPYGEWFYCTIEVDGTVANGAVRWYINNNLVAEWTGLNNTGKAGLTGAATLGFGLAGATVDICGPIISQNGTDVPIVPMDRTRQATDLVTQVFPMRFSDALRGASWKVLGSPAVPPTFADYPTGGNSPYRQRAVIASDVTLETTKPLGSLPYNELGWATLVFPMLYASDAGSIIAKLRNDANTADLVTFSMNATGFSLNAKLICTRDPTHRYAVLLHLHQTGRVHITIFDQTAGAGVRAWSGILDEVGPVGPFGPVQVEVDNDVSAEVDGFYVCKWADLVGVDSLTSGAIGGVTPAFYNNNRLARECVPCLTDAHQMPTFGPINTVYTQWGMVPGRPGRALVTVASELLNGMEHTRGCRWVQLDGGSINDLAGVTDANRKSKTDAWRAALTSLVARLTATGNRLYLMTMVRREQGTYSAVQNRVIDTMNGIIRQVAATQQRVTGGIPLIELADPAWHIDNHAALFTAGDDIHPQDPAGNLTIADAMRATRTSDTGAIGLAASLEAIVTAQNADPTQSAARTAATSAATQTTQAALKSGARLALSGRATNVGTGDDYDDVEWGDTP